METNKYLPSQELELAELLDRILDKGVCITGDLIISIADVDLVYVGLSIVLTSVDNIDFIR